MKKFPLLLLILQFCSPLLSADESQKESARIIGDIPDGTPPPPEPPKPKFIVPAKDILKSKTYQQGGRKITVQRITPIALPVFPISTMPGRNASPGPPRSSDKSTLPTTSTMAGTSLLSSQALEEPLLNAPSPRPTLGART